MGYITKEEVSRFRTMVKSTFGKDFKFSIRRDNSDTLSVSLMKSPFNVKDRYDQLNEFKSDLYDNDVKEMIDVLNFLSGHIKEHYNRNDPYADYCDYSYYKSYNIGKWDKKVEIDEKPINWKEIKKKMKQSVIKDELKK